MIPMSVIDPGFAKSQLILFLREWYMHANGMMPAYEWNFGMTRSSCTKVLRKLAGE